MAKKQRARRSLPSEPQGERSGVTAARFRRLSQLLQFLGGGPKSRERLTRHLQLDVRGFYRDLELLRGAGISIVLQDGRYVLADDLDDAMARLPFPDPRFTLGEMRQLAKGRTNVHRALQEQIDDLLS